MGTSLMEETDPKAFAASTGAWIRGPGTWGSRFSAHACKHFGRLIVFVNALSVV